MIFSQKLYTKFTRKIYQKSHLPLQLQQHRSTKFVCPNFSNSVMNVRPCMRKIERESLRLEEFRERNNKQEERMMLTEWRKRILGRSLCIYINFYRDTNTRRSVCQKGLFLQLFFGSSNMEGVAGSFFHNQKPNRLGVFFKYLNQI